MRALYTIYGSSRQSDSNAIFWTIRVRECGWAGERWRGLKPPKHNGFAVSRLFGKAQGAYRTGGVWPQQQVTKEVLRRSLEVAIGEIRRQQRYREINPEKCSVIQGDRRLGDGKTQDDHELNWKMQEIAGI